MVEEKGAECERKELELEEHGEDLYWTGLDDPRMARTQSGILSINDGTHHRRTKVGRLEEHLALKTLKKEIRKEVKLRD